MRLRRDRPLHQNTARAHISGVPIGTILKRQTSATTDHEAKRVSWELPEALWQRVKPLIPPKKSTTSHRAPSTSDASRRGSSTF
jgi:hypothetical protein